MERKLIMIILIVFGIFLIFSATAWTIILIKNNNLQKQITKYAENAAELQAYTSQNYADIMQELQNEETVREIEKQRVIEKITKADCKVSKNNHNILFNIIGKLHNYAASGANSSDTAAKTIRDRAN